MKKGRLRSLIAVLAAFVVTRSLVLAADFLVFRMFPAKFDDAGSAHDMKILIAMLCYSLVFYILGGYIAAANCSRPQAPSCGCIGDSTFGFGRLGNRLQIRGSSCLVSHRRPGDYAAGSGSRWTTTRSGLTTALQFDR
jgi:hypothetical protein